MRNVVYFKILVWILTLFECSLALASNPGISYTGRITKADGTPVLSSGVTFSVAIYDVNHSCLMATETRTLDLSSSNGTFSFDIGDGTGAASYKGNVSDIYDVFNNGKTFTGLTAVGACSGSFTPGVVNEPRTLMVSFDAGDGNGSQTLPALKINPVPFAGQSANTQKIAGYGTGDLLRIDNAVNKATNANTDLSQAQYDEFWRLVKNPGTAYLSSAPSVTLAGDVTGSASSNTVTKIQGYTISSSAPSTNNVLTWNGSAWAPAAPSGGGLSALLNSAQIYVGNASNGAQARSMSGDASMDNAGVLSLATSGVTAGTYTKITVDAKGRATVGASLGSSDVIAALGFTPANNAAGLPPLTDGQIFIGNASNIAEGRTLSGDATLSNTGVIGVDKTTTGTASKILALDGSGVANVKGVSIATGTGSIALQSAGTTTNYSLTFPAAAPAANGKFLSATTAGILSWVDAPTTSAAGSNTYVQYNSSGAFAGDSGFTYNGAGVVTVNGASTTHAVRGTTSSSGAGVRGDSSSGSGVLGNSTSGVGVSGTSSSNAGIFGSSGTNAGVFGMSTSGNGVTGSSSSASGGYFYSSGSGYALTTGAGNVGIGTSTPNRPLTVVSTDATSWTTQPADFSLSSTNPIGAGMTLRPTASTSYANGWTVYAGAGSSIIGDGSFGIWNNTTSSPKFMINQSGYVGIGAPAPYVQLHVADQVATASPRGIASQNAGGFGGLISLVASRGTLTAPTAIQSGDTIGQVIASGFDDAGLVSQSVLTTGISFLASENWASSGTHRGTEFYVNVTKNGDANASTGLYVANTRRVSVGSGSTPRAGLDVNGAIVSKPAIGVTSGSTIDFAENNLAYTTMDCKAYAIHNLKDGGTYTLVVQGTTSATCSFTVFSDSGSTSLGTAKMPPDHGATTNGTQTMYTFMNMGGTVYVGWIPGY